MGAFQSTMPFLQTPGPASTSSALLAPPPQGQPSGANPASMAIPEQVFNLTNGPACQLPAKVAKMDVKVTQMCHANDGRRVPCGEMPREKLQAALCKPPAPQGYLTQNVVGQRTFGDSSDDMTLWIVVGLVLAVFALAMYRNHG